MSIVTNHTPICRLPSKRKRTYLVLDFTLDECQFCPLLLLPLPLFAEGLVKAIVDDCDKHGNSC